MDIQSLMIKNKTKIYSEPNKLVVFNCKLKHRMVSQTDEQYKDY
jgi:hypothetical protein